MEELNLLVDNALNKHTGGEKFFDYLDDEIRVNDKIIKLLLNKIPMNKMKYIVCSGKFGLFLEDYFTYHNDIKDVCIITVPGGLRKGTKADLSQLKFLIKNNDFIFIDDSFYSGATRNEVKREIEVQGGRLVDTYVVYDGSHKKEENVHSLYRYYK